MNEKDIVQLHEHINELTEKLSYMIIMFRRQNHFAALRNLWMALNELTSVIEQLFMYEKWFNEEHEIVKPQEIKERLELVHHLQQENEYILLADVYELSILPLLYSVQEYLIMKLGFICDDEKYARTLSILKLKNQDIYQRLSGVDPVDYIIGHGITVEHSMTGALTIAIEQNSKKQYVHSNANVATEALFLAEYWYEEHTSEYIVYGLGLGYHIQALVDLSEYARIKVYESNLSVICAAAAFGVLEELLESESVEVIYDKKMTKLHADLLVAKDAVFVVHHPSLYALRDEHEREFLEEYFVQYNSVKNQKRFMDGNFKRNINAYDFPADHLYDQLRDQDVYIVAAGPSLDKNVKELKRIMEHQGLREKSVIIAVGTVFKKLLNAAIIPDYIIATDAKQGTYSQIEGLESEKVPLIGISTLYYDFFKKYQGKKYIAFQKGYQPAELYAKENNCMLFESGGSVITLALDVAIRLSCKKVILLGMDLAYTNHEMHTTDTARNHGIVNENVIHIPDIYGVDTITGMNLNIYRKWLEKRIEGLSLEIIDATEGGAYVKGTQVKQLKDVLDEALK